VNTASPRGVERYIAHLEEEGSPMRFATLSTLAAVVLLVSAPVIAGAGNLRVSGGTSASHSGLVGAHRESRSQPGLVGAHRESRPDFGFNADRHRRVVPDPRIVPAPPHRIAPNHRPRHGDDHRGTRHVDQVIIVSPPVVVSSSTRCFVPGYWTYQWVPQATTSYSWVPGYWASNGSWIQAHWQPYTVTGGAWQPLWIADHWAC
jgi:hypothetical protein